ncbi:unnamed protein product [Darwinula stevensoni]|uniref:Uncharacterized protein n=1 Tax=Darwinula stevensoni TaxID=69355 RepID=A0A7R8XCX7_9CRUS|nr:unnamed protein product [Darwinula stevensoni]CAG0892447.1 unnamed protein product [Darwinula stevensoni]
MDEEGNEEDEGIQIFIETLTGTKYHLQVSRLETVISLKARIQKYEGVPIIHQHLVFQGNELDNEAQLGDSLLYDGATLRLVISMRGGPINMRRVSSSDSTLLDVKEFMEANQEEIWEHLPSGEPVTLLMYRDGDQVNLYRVIETTDGHFSPLSQSWNGHAIRNLFWEDEEENRQRSMENRITQSKMEQLNPTLSTVSEIRGLSFNVLNDHEGREVLDILNRHRYLSAKMSRVHTAQKKAASLKPPETEKKNERSLLEEMQGLTLDDSGHCQHRLHASQGVQLNRFSPLPPLVPLQRRTSDRPRCTRCRKKLTLTTIFSCHCGKSFCAIHRYAEAHGCSFDYKSEGRKVLEKGNPLITAPKLPKI